MSAVANDLQAGFEILWYQIESVLGRGGFGITYLARDNNLGQLVAIKEYLPHDFATRSGDSTVQPVSVEQEDVFSWGLERFMSEAQTLAMFKHPNVVRVLSVFKHNNTGYMVMEYEQGEDLSDVYKRKQKLTQRELEDIYYPVIDGLSSVHKEGFIHRDIKPSNIYIRTDGSPVLIDFGAARQAVGSKTKTLTSMLSVGYAPFEQYNDEPGKQGPWTDVYALGASLHQGITGEKPLESTIRGMALLHDEPDPYEPLSQFRIEGYSQAFLRAIDQALMLQIHDRPQTLEDFLGMLKGEIALPDLPIASEKVTESTAIRDKTIIRPVKRIFSDADIEVTHPEQPAKNEATASRIKNPSDTAGTEEKEQPTQKFRSFIPDLLAHPKFRFAMGGIAVVIVVVVIFFPGEPSQEELRQLKMEELLAKADELIAGGNYFDETGNGALGAYREVVAIDPNNSSARNGIDKVARHYLQQAERLIADKDFAEADGSLKIVESIEPEFPGLKQARARFSEQIASELRFRKIKRFISEAGHALEQGRIYEPADKSALFYYQQVLKLDAENVAASTGLLRIAGGLIDQVRTALEKNDADLAEKMIARVEEINPAGSALPDLRQQISKIREFDRILARADDAYAKQRYTTPRENNAYDLYKQALAIAPTNRRARGQLNEIAEFYVDKTRRFTRSGNIASANNNLAVLENFFPKHVEIANLKTAINKKQAQINKKQAQINAQKTDERMPPAVKPPTSNRLLPVDVNQNQDDFQVVQDIVERFIIAFENRDLKSLRDVSQLSPLQQEHYAKIFKLYPSLNIALVPKSFSLNNIDGIARAKFEISNLVDAAGIRVVSSANWTRIEIKITRREKGWQKIVIKYFN